MFLWNGSHVEWTGDTEFSSNEASADGGVVGSYVLDSLYNPQGSYLIVGGTTIFSNNTSGANGGALALLGGVSVTIGTENAVVVGNTAAVAGGAVFVSSTAVGPTFVNVSLISNSAQVGGAISLIGSGTSFNPEDYTPAPTTFEQCRFTSNRAIATGGAVDTAAGQDKFVNSVHGGDGRGSETGGHCRGEQLLFCGERFRRRRGRRCLQHRLRFKSLEPVFQPQRLRLPRGHVPRIRGGEQRRGHVRWAT